MKKLLAMLLTLVMVFSLCACGGGDPDKKESEDKEGVIVDNDSAQDTSDDSGEDKSVEDEKEETKPAEKTIVGKWKAKVDLTEDVDKELSENLINFTDLLRDYGLTDYELPYDEYLTVDAFWYDYLAQLL